jgi:hypothetical protein
MLNRILRTFLLHYPSGFAALQAFVDRFGTGTDVAEVIAPAETNGLRFVQLCEQRRPQDPIAMARTIDELQDEIRAFTARSTDTELTKAARVLSTALRDVFASSLKKFEADALGAMGVVMATFVGIRIALADIRDAWQPAAEAAIRQLDELLGHHAPLMEPICSIEARLNPNYGHAALFDDEEQDRTTNNIIKGVRAFVAFQPSSVARIERADVRRQSSDEFDDLLSYTHTRAEADVGQENLDVKVSGHLRQYDLDCLTLEGMTRDWVGYWVEKSAVWPELAGYALSILTRPVDSVMTARHFPLTAEMSRL